MKDEATGSEWLHMTGESYKGPLTGSRLTAHSGRHVLWREWKQDHPNTDVMAPVDPSQQFSREDSYRGTGTLPVEFARVLHDTHNALHASDLLFGVDSGVEAKAYPFKSMLGHKTAVVNDVLARDPIVVGLHPITRSPFGYRRILDGTVLSLQWLPSGHLFDTASGSKFNLAGRGVSGPHVDQQLEPLRSMQCEWYGWYSSRPHTTIWTPKT